VRALSRRNRIFLLLGLEFLIALAVYGWCVFQGACSGDCVAVGYVVAETCFGLAAKTLVALFITTGVALILVKK
jgi:uncharacterized membrane protein YciS (DUF1049 family)